MTDAFEDHCWKDAVSADVLEIYRHYKREVFVGPRPALLIIDLYNLSFYGGAEPVAEVVKAFPSACGINAWNAIAPTKKLIAAAREAHLPIFYTTGDTRAASQPDVISATKRQSKGRKQADMDIFPEFAPQPGDVVIAKQRASGFYGTPLTAHLTLLGIQSLIVIGTSTSGCVRASAVDAYSHGYHVTMAEECCFDRSDISHKINLFDLHHKYADVMKTDEIIAYFKSQRRMEAAQ